MSLKDRLHREHQVSVAEVGMQDRVNVARMGLAIVGSDGKHIGQTLDRITLKLRALHDAQLGDTRREILRDPQGADSEEAEADAQAAHEATPLQPSEARSLADEMLARLDGDLLEGGQDGPANPGHDRAIHTDRSTTI
jgi:uncharacterized protein YlxP (DUF503 family)